MGAVHFGVPESLALFLKDRLRLDTFVETGTYGGGTASWAARHFTAVHSIEASEKYWRDARTRYGSLHNIDFIHGHSPTALAALIPRLARPLFWLDAHWCGGETAGAEAECPLIEEIAAIAAARLPDPVILIDDARLFLEPPPAPHRWEEWPDLAAVVAALQRCGDLHVAVREDVIVALPREARADLVAHWRADPAASMPSPGSRPRRLRHGFLKRSPRNL
jgi:hypothetical protein